MVSLLSRGESARSPIRGSVLSEHQISSATPRLLSFPRFICLMALLAGLVSLCVSDGLGIESASFPDEAWARIGDAPSVRTLPDGEGEELPGVPAYLARDVSRSRSLVYFEEKPTLAQRIVLWIRDEDPVPDTSVSYFSTGEESSRGGWVRIVRYRSPDCRAK